MGIAGIFRCPIVSAHVDLPGHSKPDNTILATMTFTAKKHRFPLLPPLAALSSIVLVCACLHPVSAASGYPDDQLSYLKGLSIEELLQTEITTVSKKAERLFDVAAAVTVITQEEIQRSGAQSIPEALRMVPGVQVAQIDSSRYAISARGFNEYFANKLLVLIDGRSVYTPLFSGVYWNAQDTLIEDIDRIEVIRGPGATVWGANAVNGVINIITKNARDTQGGLVAATVGSYEQPLLSARYGGTLDDATSYRIYAKGFERTAFESVHGGDAHDSWESLRAGFRIDRERSEDQALSFQGEIYSNEADVTSNLSSFFTPPFMRDVTTTEDYSGGHLLATWKRHLSASSEINVQMYYDHTSRDQFVAEEKRDTVDLEFKHHWDPKGRHDIVWGGGFRWTQDEIDGSFAVSFEPHSRTDQLWNAFIQDDINLIDDTAWVTLGSKFEHNDYSGYEIQPSVRFRFIPADRQLLWGAVSRAIRAPSRSDHDIVTNFATRPADLNSYTTRQLRGDDSFDSEELIAYELGFRWQLHDDLSFDIATFYNDYNNIRSFTPGTPFLDTYDNIPLLVQPLFFTNTIDGNSYGAELQATWQPLKKLKLYAAYSFITIDLDYEEASQGFGAISEEELTPRHQFQIRSYMDLTSSLSLDSALYYVSELEDDRIGSYVRFDLQLSWHPSDGLVLSVGGSNIFNSEHQEFPSRSNIEASEVPRQYWLKATYRF